MTSRELESIKARIQRIKQELVEIDEMRPGSLTQQQRRGQTGLYYQLSYTHKMKGRTEYVRAEFVPEIRRQIENYRRFKRLVGQWVNLAIKYSKAKMVLARDRPNPAPGARGSRRLKR